jgi:hypothetical protein
MLEQSEINGWTLANVNPQMGKYCCIIGEITVVHVSVNGIGILIYVTGIILHFQA